MSEEFALKNTNSSSCWGCSFFSLPSHCRIALARRAIWHPDEIVVRVISALHGDAEVQRDQL
ncbi:MAG: hypothetical protein U0X87_13680 [Anaerolineales bacterium]